ncbi:MAG TPA: AAA family ATPase [Puia sp.]|jgi:energy-coupling factor transporter ATP-binding protein EcfA2|nr:AAA family ATPase [Puia sp.]
MKIKHVEISNFRGIKKLSWSVPGHFNCLIGPGDTCKTTLLTAIDYALSPRNTLYVDDSDFYQQDISQPITIQVTISDWDEGQEEIRDLFRESRFGRHKCGLDASGPLPEPQDNVQALSVCLRVDQHLEPKWVVLQERDTGQEGKPIFATDRAVIGLSRIDAFSDAHFTWGRNTLLSRLSVGHGSNVHSLISELARHTRQSDISGHSSIINYQTVASSIETEARTLGVNLSELSPKLDIQKQSLNAGAISLHEDNVPLRNRGSGSKKLIFCAIQMKLHDGKNISLIDELETGLEPHRIRGLLFKLKQSQQQIFTTTHSPVVLRELKVSENELHVCKVNQGIVTIENVSAVEGIQANIRRNAEAFLGRKIVVCEGATEIGLLRAYDVYRFDERNPPVWTLSTAYFDACGGSNVKRDAVKLSSLGYLVAAFMDNDSGSTLLQADLDELNESHVHLCQWEAGKATEHQLFHELPWEQVPAVLRKIADHHDTVELATIIDSITKWPSVRSLNLSTDMDSWTESPNLRLAIGEAAHARAWIKRIDYAEQLFAFVLPLLPTTSGMQTKLNSLWAFIQHD